MNHESHPFLSNLEEIHGAESRIAAALSKMNKSDASEELKLAILSHLKDTEGNISRVEEIYNHFSGRNGQDYLESNAQPGDKRSQDLALISSLKSISDAGPPTNGSQRAWENASYGCLNEWDGLLDSVDAANLLEAILEDERTEDPFADDLT